MLYLYPDNLKSKATLWLWELRDVGIIGASLLFAIFVASQTGTLFPLVFSMAFAFLTIRFEDTSILDFLRYAVSYFIVKQQLYTWKLG